MNKKIIIQQLLEKLIPHRDLAAGLLLIVQSQEITDEIVDGLIAIFTESIETINDTQIQKHLIQTQQKLKDMKLLEQQQRRNEQWDAELMLLDIDD